MTPISIESVPCPLPSVRIVIPEASVSLPATVTPPTSSEASPVPPQSLSLDPLPPRNDSEEEEDDEEEEDAAPSQSLRKGDKEKIGRWSEHEHLVFLDGLRLYGKQWKTIAGMIGTRTVVQVRTHAQKYFQKVDRSSSLSDIARPVKRKSLTVASPPSRKSRKLQPRRSMPTIPTTMTTELLSLDLPSFPSTISKSSSSSGSDGENWSTISPNTVVQLVEMPASNGDDAMDEWDPLEWLIETDGTQNYLPESSLPIFPFSDDKLIVPDDDEEPSAEMGEMDLVQDAILNNMVDPNVTMQSLFLPEDEMDENQ